MHVMSALLLSTREMPRLLLLLKVITAVVLARADLVTVEQFGMVVSSI